MGQTRLELLLRAADRVAFAHSAAIEGYASEAAEGGEHGGTFKPGSYRPGAESMGSDDPRRLWADGDGRLHLRKEKVLSMTISLTTVACRGCNDSTYCWHSQTSAHNFSRIDRSALYNAVSTEAR